MYERRKILPKILSRDDSRFEKIEKKQIEKLCILRDNSYIFLINLRSFEIKKCNIQENVFLSEFRNLNMIFGIEHENRIFKC